MFIVFINSGPNGIMTIKSMMWVNLAPANEASRSFSCRLYDIQTILYFGLKKFEQYDRIIVYKKVYKSFSNRANKVIFKHSTDLKIFNWKEIRIIFL